jgi:hypothetical protein
MATSFAGSDLWDSAICSAFGGTVEAFDPAGGGDPAIAGEDSIGAKVGSDWTIWAVPASFDMRSLLDQFVDFVIGFISGH